MAEDPVGPPESSGGFQFFYRTISSNPPSADDFLSDEEAGIGDEQPPADRAGRSVFDRPKEAIERAKYVQKIRKKYSDDARPIYVAAVRVPFSQAGTGAVHARQTGANPHHFQLFGDKEDLAALAEIVWPSDD